MEQLDFITANHYLYDKISKLEKEMGARAAYLFEYIKELQDEMIEVKKNYNQLSVNYGQLEE